jgi:hypothetical protein
MEPDIESLRENYSLYSDEKLVQIASEEARRLRPEAVQVLGEEIRKRGLGDDYFTSIEAQRQELTPDNMEGYLDLLSSLPCPVCKSNSKKLNATIKGTVVSVLFYTQYEKKLIIACPKCLKAANNEGLYYSGFFGWWALPWGPIRTIQSLILNSKMLKNSKAEQPNELFEDFVGNNVGKIELNKDDQTVLSSLIKFD